MLPSEASQALFENLYALGSDFTDSGQLSAEILAKIASPERFHTILGPLFQVFLRLPTTHSYFDNMLKQNSAIENDLPGLLWRVSETGKRMRVCLLFILPLLGALHQ